MIGLTARNFGKLPSELLKIENDALALDFNLACTHRLLKFDNERKTDEIAAQSAAMFGGAGNDSTNAAGSW